MDRGTFRRRLLRLAAAPLPVLFFASTALAAGGAGTTVPAGSSTVSAGQAIRSSAHAQVRCEPGARATARKRERPSSCQTRTLAEATVTKFISIQKNVNDVGINCYGELVNFVGTEKFDFRFVVDSESGLHSLFIDLVASGQGTAAMPPFGTYVFNEYSSSGFNIPGPTEAFESDIHFFYRAIRQGEPPPPFPADDMLLHSVFHFTQNGNGVFTATVTHTNPQNICS